MGVKHTGPLLGYNNNVRYQGRVYHLQTEDSGSKRPHVITHLFADGGRVIQSNKTGYAELVGTDGMADEVRELMRNQHKAMAVALKKGEFDDILGVEPIESPDDAEHEEIEAELIEPELVEPEPSEPELLEPELLEDASDDAAEPGTNDVDTAEPVAAGPKETPVPLERLSPPQAMPAPVISEDPPTRRTASSAGAYSYVSNATPRKRTPSGAARRVSDPAPPSGNRLFGERFISDRGLDEVVAAFFEQ